MTSLIAAAFLIGASLKYAPMQTRPCSRKSSGSARQRSPIRMRSVIIFGITMPNEPLPEWEALLSSAAPVGSLDGIETGVRQLIRDQPLETEVIEISGEKLTVPTRAEMLRIKAVLIVKRNATRDYLDFVAMSDLIGLPAVLDALKNFDLFYPQPNGQSARQQLQIQLANPMPYDLDATNLREYKKLRSEYQDWTAVAEKCRELANVLW